MIITSTRVMRASLGWGVWRVNVVLAHRIFPREFAGAHILRNIGR